MKRTIPHIKLFKQVLRVPEEVYENKNYIEAKAVVHGFNHKQGIYDHRVVGTADTQNLELYGWKNPIGMHVDSTINNLSYFAILDNNTTEICVRTDGTYDIVHPKIGDIVRLNDSLEHGTTGMSSCVALFCGTFKRSCDAKIIKKMQLGINRLAQNIRSPKIALPLTMGFYHGECLVAGKYSAELTTVKVADKFNREILYCHQCDNLAVVADKMFPYGDKHQCGTHRKEMP